MSQVQVTAGQRAAITKRVTLVGAVANVLLSILKILFGWLGNSQALLADGIHSLSDLLSDLMVYVAAHHSHHGPDAQHPYGHGRFETIATLGLALLLVMVAVGLIWDAGVRLFSPESLKIPAAITLYVAALSVLIKEALYHYTRRAAQRIRSEMMRANAWHHRSDAVSSIVVFVGLAGTMAGLPYLDAIAAVLVGFMILHIAWELGWGSLKELVDTGLDAERVQEIRSTILAVAGVKDIHMLRTRMIGGVATADVHVLVPSRISVSEGHMISVMVEKQLKEHIDEIEDVTVHIDPEDDEEAPTCENLPLRGQAELLLEQAWKQIPEAALRTRLVLHYLNGRIEADLYFPGAMPWDAKEVIRLRNTLQAALSDRPEFGKIHIYLEYAP